VAFGNHLRAGEDVDIAVAKGAQNAFESPFAAGAVAIETGRLRATGRQRCVSSSTALRSRYPRIESCHWAHLGRRWDFLGEAAVVASHAAVAAMMRQYDGAVLGKAGRSPHARHTMKLESRGGLSSSMVLLALCEPLEHFLDQFRAKGSWRFVSRNSTRMSPPALAHGALCNPLGQPQHLVLP